MNKTPTCRSAPPQLASKFRGRWMRFRIRLGQSYSKTTLINTTIGKSHTQARRYFWCLGPYHKNCVWEDWCRCCTGYMYLPDT